MKPLINTKIVLAIFCLIFATSLMLLKQHTSASPAEVIAKETSTNNQQFLLASSINLDFRYIRGYVSNPNTNQFYVAGENSIIVIDTNSGSIIGNHTGFAPSTSIRGLGLNEDGSVLFALIDNSVVKIDAVHFNIIDTYDCDCESAIDIAYGRDGRLFIGSTNKIQVMDEHNGNILGSIAIPFHYNYDLQIIPAKSLLFAMKFETEYPLLYKYDISGDDPVQLDYLNPNVYNARFAISADGNYISVVGGTSEVGLVKQFRADNFELLNSIENNKRFVHTDTSTDSQSIYAVTGKPFYGGTLYSFNATTGSIEGSIGVNSIGYGISFLTTLQDDKIVIGSTSNVRIFSPVTDEIMLPLILKNYCSAPYFDDFSDPNSGWPISISGSTKYQYINNEYQIYHDKANRWSAVTAGHVMVNNETTIIEGHLANQQEGIWGFVFGLNDNWSNFYTFEILPHRQLWAILHFNDQTGWNTVQSGNSNFIKTGTQINELKIQSLGSSQRFYINDNLITSTSMQPGRIGLSGGAIDAGVDLRYDNYIFAHEHCPISIETQAYNKDESISELNINHPLLENSLTLEQD